MVLNSFPPTQTSKSHLLLLHKIFIPLSIWDVPESFGLMKYVDTLILHQNTPESKVGVILSACDAGDIVSDTASVTQSIIIADVLDWSVGSESDPALAGDVTLVTLWHVWCCQDAGVRWQWWCPHVTEGHSVTWAVLSLLVRIQNTGSGDRKLSFSCQQETELSAGQNTNQHRNSSAMDANHHLTHQLQIVHLNRQMIVWLVVVGKTQIFTF